MKFEEKKIAIYPYFQIVRMSDTIIKEDPVKEESKITGIKPKNSIFLIFLKKKLLKPPYLKML